MGSAATQNDGSDETGAYVIAEYLAQACQAPETEFLTASGSAYMPSLLNRARMQGASSCPPRSTHAAPESMAITLNSTRQRAFGLLLTAVGVSAVGSRVTRTALPMAAILLLGATPLQLGWLSVLGVLPGALVAWWAGAWIDRHSRRAVMIGADWVRALVIASVPLAAVIGHVTLTQLGLVAAFMCVATVLFEIADHAFLPVIIPSEHLVPANSKREAINSLAEIPGPSLGGALVQWLTAPFALAVDACSFVASALLIGQMRAREPLTNHKGQSQRATGTQLLREAREGVHLVWRHPLVRPLFLSTIIYYFFMSIAASLYTLF